jgi:DNA polymerase III subunit epsilon
MSNSFVAIDFETANSFQGSACEVGLYKVVDGLPSGQFHSLVRPHRNHARFDGINQSIHGIGPRDVDTAPEFADLWPTISDFVADFPLVAHNAAFDVRVLRELFQLYSIQTPTVTYFCTLVLSRRILDLVSYSLPFVAESLGIEHVVMHRASSDAECAADIALKLLEKSGQPSLNELADSLRVSVGSFDGHSWFSSRSDGHAAATYSVAAIEEIRKSLGMSDSADPDGPLFGRSVAFTGGLSSMTRKEAAARVLEAGGEPQVGVNKATDFLVVGAENGYTIDPKTATTAKFDKARVLRAKGSKIEILDELTFSQML